MKADLSRTIERLREEGALCDDADIGADAPQHGAEGGPLERYRHELSGYVAKWQGRLGCIDK